MQRKRSQPAGNPCARGRFLVATRWRQLFKQAFQDRGHALGFVSRKRTTTAPMGGYLRVMYNVHWGVHAARANPSMRRSDGGASKMTAVMTAQSGGCQMPHGNFR